MKQQEHNYYANVPICLLIEYRREQSDTIERKHTRLVYAHQELKILE